MHLKTFDKGWWRIVSQSSTIPDLIWTFPLPVRIPEEMSRLLKGQLRKGCDRRQQGGFEEGGRSLSLPAELLIISLTIIAFPPALPLKLRFLSRSSQFLPFHRSLLIEIAFAVYGSVTRQGLPSMESNEVFFAGSLVMM